MTMIGYSTGAIARGDFGRGLHELRARGVRAVELSALRERELPALVDAFAALDLSSFDYVSLHLPSRFEGLGECAVIELLERVPGHIPLVLHPDAVNDVSLWRHLDRRLCLENMDQRKRTGRTLEELEVWLERLPGASVCFDIGHARQVDPSMTLAVKLLLRLGGRIVQVHMSEVTPKGEHIAMTFGARSAYAKVANLLPANAPVILESVVEGAQIDSELRVAEGVLCEGQQRARAVAAAGAPVAQPAY